MSPCQQAARQSGHLGARKRVIVASAWRPPPLPSNQLAAHHGPVCRRGQQGRRCSLLNAVFYSLNTLVGGGSVSQVISPCAGATAFGRAF